jgi:superfamily I DNA/RNA helicase
LHPDQKRVVNADFKGPARLLGVSGSGKTSVLVHRAVRLAQKYEGKKILVLTLNESLSKLIKKLVDLILETKQLNHLKDFIEVSSFWEICHDLIVENSDGDKLIPRILSNVTEKTEETIDEIWEEFYCLKVNNEDAKVLLPVHQSLLTRGIRPQEYLRQEFDWIRSAFPQTERDQYLTVEREGRFIPLMEEDRKNILTGLKHWEDKMAFVGATDYLGLTNLVYKHLESISPKYNCILVDEVQDFGTIELTIVRKLVPLGENDLFLCGDIAQQVYNKQHKLRRAGISILPEGFLKILKNYRNSREILETAYSVFKSNVDMDKLKSEDFEVLNPEYANYSSPKPFLRKGESINDEFSSAYEYLKQTLDAKKGQKGCIAICGISSFKLVKLAQKLNLPVLSGNNDLSEGDIFLSDLEQTKGFEFDKVIILNCSDATFPNSALPKEEWFREISKLYVAMTRAKKELTISFSEKRSTIFESSVSYFTEDNWSDHIMEKEGIEIPVGLVNDEETISLQLTGSDFLYTKQSIGMSKELQNKLVELVAGVNVTDEKRRRVGWSTMELLRRDVITLKDVPTLNRLFGPTVFNELYALFESVN